MKRFVEEYCADFNGAAAARRAGYSERYADRQAWQLLEDSRVSKAISKRLDTLSMSAEEALIRLTEQGRNLQMQHLKPDGTVNLRSLIDAGLVHLVKGTKFNAQGVLQVEFYDAQAAQKLILQAHGAFGPDGSAANPLHVVPIQVNVINQPSTKKDGD